MVSLKFFYGILKISGHETFHKTVWSTRLVPIRRWVPSFNYLVELLGD